MALNVQSHARRLVAFAPFAIALTLASTASAVDAKVEAAAKKSAADAMDTDYLALDLKKAKAKLLKAIERCGEDKCSPQTSALLHRDLGVVLAAGKDKGADAEFDAALALDPKGDVAKDYLSNADVKKAWEAAKKRVKASDGGGKASGGGESSAGIGVKFTVAPVGYELPVVVTVPKDLEVASIKVSFKTEAMDKYRSLEAQKQGKVFVAIIPCAHTNAPGEIKYFVKAFDEGGNELDHKGSVKSPETIQVVASMPDGEEAPSLPGDQEPKSCAGEGDKKPEGSGCESDDECQGGLVCNEGDEGKKRCESGERKSGSKKAAGATPRFFVGIDGQIDFMSVSATHDLCNQSGWACSADNVTNWSGRADLPNPDITLANGGKTEGGTSMGTARVMATLDYFVSSRFAMGLRLGYAFNGNPTSTHPFKPIHAEVRLHYFFTESTVRPFLGLGIGYGEIDAKVTGVVVRPDNAQYADPNVTDSQGNPIIPSVNGYRTSGPMFVSVGTGAWIFVSRSFAIDLGLKVVMPLQNFSLAFAPEAGIKLGF
jgi:hypothetical protein